MKKKILSRYFSATLILLVTAVYLLLLVLPIRFMQSPSASDYVKVPVEDVMKGYEIRLDQDSSEIRNYIWKNGFLHPPAKYYYKYNLTSKRDPSMGQGQMVRQILRNMRNGFFVECGALDGETRSNTLFLETNRGWRGLLIEADPKNYEILLKKNRRAWSSNSCLATKDIPHEVIFNQQFNMGKIGATNTSRSLTVEGGSNKTKVQCFPFYSLLSALGVHKVDYFSLDVEGNEMDVLRTIPFHLIDIKIISVEYIHVPEGKDYMQKFMETKGYFVAREVINPFGFANDFIFIKNGLIKKSNRYFYPPKERKYPRKFNRNASRLMKKSSRYFYPDKEMKSPRKFNRNASRLRKVQIQRTRNERTRLKSEQNFTGVMN